MNDKLKENFVFFNEWADSYDWPLFQFWMKRFYRPLLKRIGSDDTVLDVSCGSGQFLHELSQISKARLEGIDFSDKMVKIAQEKLSKKAIIRKGDVHNLEYSDNSFDYVVSTEAFHHYYDQEKALSEMKRASKKGGNIVVVDVNFFTPLIHKLFEIFEPGCVKINNKKQMRELFINAELKNIQQRRSFLFAVETWGVKR